MLTDNILSVYRRAAPDEVIEGMNWYNEAHEFALSLDPENPSRAAGIIAVLSPLSGWQNNRNKAEQFYRQHGQVRWDGTSNGIGLASNVRKAERIWNGADPLEVMRSAHKTRAFYQTILDPTGDHNPVIDRHAYDIAVGRPTGNRERSAIAKETEYDRFSQAYREVAICNGIAPAQLQAITWVTWRNELGKAWYG